MTIAAIIQAHMGSVRLPGKVARTIIDRTMLEHLVLRLKVSRQIDTIIIATSTLPRDDEVSKIAKKCEVNCFRGSEENVLERFLQAAISVKSKIAIRVTSDNPLTDPFMIDYLIEEHQRCGVDYTWMDGMPIGTAAEAVSVEALQKAISLTKNPYDLEHVTPFIRNNPKIFNIQILPAPSKFHRPEIRLTVDYKDDFDFITNIFNCLYKPDQVFPLDQVIELIDQQTKTKIYT
jgi:spore coat polysaccharide biosynthesis protein SpsF